MKASSGDPVSRNKEAIWELWSNMKLEPEMGEATINQIPALVTVAVPSFW